MEILGFNVLELIVLAFATYRVTRLIVDDTFPPIRWTREKITGSRPTGSLLVELLECQYCVSVYVAFGLTALVWFWPVAWWAVAPMALSGAGVAVYNLVEEEV